MLLTLLVFIKIPLNVFPCDIRVFWGFGGIELPDWVLVELDCSFLDGEVVIFGIPQRSQSQKAL